MEAIQEATRYTNVLPSVWRVCSSECATVIGDARGLAAPELSVMSSTRRADTPMRCISMCDFRAGSRQLFELILECFHVSQYNLLRYALQFLFRVY